MEDLDVVMRYLASLGVGLLLGLERERNQTAKAGLRTFAMVALLGTTCAMLGQAGSTPWLTAAVALGLALMMIAAHRSTDPAEDPGTTTTVALLLCFTLGALIWHGYRQVSVTVALVVTALLYFKTELHGVTRHLSRHDWLSLLGFAVVTFVVLPVLPDRDLGPLAALNPYRIWLMVVLVSGLSFAGFVVLRVLGNRRGLPMIGIMGGLVSSTATTLAYSRLARAGTLTTSAGVVVALAANGSVLAKLLAIAAVVAPAVVPALILPLGLGLAAAVPVTFALWHRLPSETDSPHLAVDNPSEMKVALGFAVIFAVVSLALAWLHQAAGMQGVYAMAAVSGVADIDAISVSALHMTQSGELTGTQAARAIALAYATSVGLKLGIGWVVAGRQFARLAIPGYLLVLVGIGAGLWLSPDR